MVEQCRILQKFTKICKNLHEGEIRRRENAPVG